MHIFVGWLWIDGWKSFHLTDFLFSGLQLLREEATSTSSLSIDSRESHQGIPDSVSWYINDWGSVFPWGIFLRMEIWVGPDRKGHKRWDVFYFLLLFPVTFFRIIINLLDHHGPSSWKSRGASCISNHLPQKKCLLFGCLSISNRDGSMTVRKHSHEEKAARHLDECLNPVLRVRRFGSWDVLSLYFVVARYGFNRRSLTTFSTSFGSTTTTTTTITRTTQLPEVAASTKECLFLQTGVGYVFAQAAWHLKLSTWKRKHICITYQSLDFSCSFLGYVPF